jgi:hypothetical protein
MSGQSTDLPEGFELDVASADDLTLEGILREAGIDPALAQAKPAPRPPTMHERMAHALRTSARPTDLAHVTFDDPPEQVAAWVRGHTGRTIGSEPTWIRVIRPDLSRGALFVLHSPHPDNEAELIVCADRGVITRALIVDVCRWAFFGLGLGRIVVRIPADRPDLSDLARRARFKHEGTARRFYRGTTDAQVWAMAGIDCSWLMPRSSESPAAASIPSPSSVKVH